MAASHRSAPAPEFPNWPFNCLSLYTHMMRDFGGCAQAVSRSTDPMEVERAEADFGVRLFADLMQGYYDLALAPWTAMAAAMAEQQGRSPSPPEAEATAITTARARPR